MFGFNFSCCLNQIFTIQKVKQNLGWALTYNAIAIPLAAGVLLPNYGFSMSPSIAGVCKIFSFSSILSQCTVKMSFEPLLPTETI